MKRIVIALFVVLFTVGVTFAGVNIPMDTRGSDIVVDSADSLFVDPLNDDLCASFSADLFDFVEELDKCNAGGEDDADGEE